MVTGKAWAEDIMVSLVRKKKEENQVHWLKSCLCYGVMLEECYVDLEPLMAWP